MQSMRELEEQRKQIRAAARLQRGARDQTQAPALHLCKTCAFSTQLSACLQSIHSAATKQACAFSIKLSACMQSIRELEEQRKQITAAGKAAADQATRQRESSQAELKAERETAADLQVSTARPAAGRLSGCGLAWLACSASLQLLQQQARPLGSWRAARRSLKRSARLQLTCR